MRIGSGQTRPTREVIEICSFRYLIADSRDEQKPERLSSVRLVMHEMPTLYHTKPVKQANLNIKNGDLWLFGK